MRNLGFGIGIAAVVAVIAGVGLANRAVRFGEWDFGDPQWWGSDPAVMRP